MWLDGCTVYDEGEGEVAGMGTTHVTVTVRNPAQPDKTWDGLFRVDPTSMNSLVPGRHLRAIGLQPFGKRSHRQPDGSEVEMDAAGAEVEFMGDVTCTTVIFGPDAAEPILGVTALESVGIEVDPRNERLKRLPAVRLK